MKKVLTLMLVFAMLVSFSMYGCKKNGTTEGEDTVATTTAVAGEEAEKPALESGADYLRAAFKADYEKEYAKFNYDSMRYEIGIDNLAYLLNFVGIQTEELPDISNLSIGVFGGEKEMSGGYELSANVNGHDVSLDMLLNLENFEYIFASNLFDDVYGFTVQELAEMSGADLPDMDLFNGGKMMEFGYAVEKAITTIGNMLVDYADITLADNGDTVNVTFDMNDEDFMVVVEEAIKVLSEDETIDTFLTELYGVDLSETLTYIDENRTEYDEMFDEINLGVSANFVIEKESLFVPKYDMSVTLGEWVLDFTYESDGVDSVLTCVAPEDVTVTLSEHAEDKNYELSLAANYVYSDYDYDNDEYIYVPAEFLLVFTANGEDAVIDVTVDTPKYEEYEDGFEYYDEDIGEYVSDTWISTRLVGKEQQKVKISGKYTLSEKEFTYQLTEVKIGSFKLNLEKAGITFAYELDVEFDELPAVTKKALEVSEEEWEVLISDICTKLDIDMSMLGMGEAEPDYYDVYESEFDTEAEIIVID